MLLLLIVVIAIVVEALPGRIRRKAAIMMSRSKRQPMMVKWPKEIKCQRAPPFDHVSLVHADNDGEVLHRKNSGTEQ